MNLEIIISVLIAMFLYNIVIKALSATVIKHVLNSKAVETELKSFKEKLAEKMEEKEKTEQ